MLKKPTNKRKSSTLKNNQENQNNQQNINQIHQNNKTQTTPVKIITKTTKCELFISRTNKGSVDFCLNEHIPLINQIQDCLISVSNKVKVDKYMCKSLEPIERVYLINSIKKQVGYIEGIFIL